MKAQLTQRRKLEGSFTNYLMGNNSSLPEVGKGATLLSYTDRHPAEVLEVSDDKRKCIIREMDTKASPDAGGMGHQDWILTANPDAPKQTLVYRNGAWRREIVMVDYEESWYNSFKNTADRWEAEKRLGLWDEDFRSLKLLPGCTKIKKRYDKVNILFGRAEYHYDWEF
jgi:hypothetical protein